MSDRREYSAALLAYAEKWLREWAGTIHGAHHSWDKLIDVEATLAQWRADLAAAPSAPEPERAALADVTLAALGTAQSVIGQCDCTMDDHGETKRAWFAARDRVLALLGVSRTALTGPPAPAVPSDAEQALKSALINLLAAHDGYRHGAGPCFCAAHEDARAVLARLGRATP